MSKLETKKQVRNITNAFNYYYAVEMTNGLQQLYDVITGNGFQNLVQNLFVKAGDALTSLRGYPLKVSQLDPTVIDNVWRDKIVMNNAEWQCKCTELNAYNMYSFNVISHFISEATSWIDLEPYTQMQLYLPYMDYVDIPVNEVRGKFLSVDYVVDLSSGVCSAFISVKSNNKDDKHVIAIKNGKLGIDIAWGETNRIENTKNIINSALSTAISLTTIELAPVNPTTFAGDTIKRIGIAGSASKGALSIMNSLQSRYSRGGNAGCLNNMFSSSTPYLIIKKPKLVPVNEEDYAHIYGKPLYESRVLAQVSGFTIVDEIHLTGLPDAMEEEVNEIERLLKEGVHL